MHHASVGCSRHRKFRLACRSRHVQWCALITGFRRCNLRAAHVCAQGTLLVLDEPTNHLDIPSKEMLEEALQRFDGSVIAVSHDRYFLRRIATRVVTVRTPAAPKPLIPLC